MTIPLSKHVGEGEGAGEPLETMGAAEGGPSSPPPLPQASASSDDAAAMFSPDASRAPTLRPPPAPAEAAAGATSSGRAENLGERTGLGFTSVVRHLSLRGWLRWIYSNRSHATLRVRTRDGGHGHIWCTGGRIIDAEWGALIAEEALQEMLGLPSGAVTIDFDPIDRPCRITKPMRELLFGIGTGSSTGADLARHGATLAASPPGAPREQPFRNSVFLQLGKEEQAALAKVRRFWLRARGISRAEYLGGGLLLATFLFVAFAVGRYRGSRESDPAPPEPQQAQQTKALLPSPAPLEVQPGAPRAAPAPHELPVIPFVALEVEPRNAEVWLDQSLVGVGRLELAAMPDGAMHELRFVAAGYETRNLYFVGTPPAGRVWLERAGERAPVAERSKPDPAPNGSGEVAAVRDDEAEEGARLKGGARRRAAAVPPMRARGPADGSTPVAKPARPKTSPQIQLIEARTPRVQVLD
jgi:hypothetical protein